jgi:hypothetical protein
VKPSSHRPVYFISGSPYKMYRAVCERLRSARRTRGGRSRRRGRRGAPARAAHTLSPAHGVEGNSQGVPRFHSKSIALYLRKPSIAKPWESIQGSGSAAGRGGGKGEGTAKSTISEPPLMPVMAIICAATCV